MKHQVFASILVTLAWGGAVAAQEEQAPLQEQAGQGAGTGVLIGQQLGGQQTQVAQLPTDPACSSFADQHLVIIIESTRNQGRIAFDGWLKIPEGTQGGSRTIPWTGVYLAPDTSQRAVADLGYMPDATHIEFNPGFNRTGSTAGEHLVDQGTWLCQNGVCDGTITACHGQRLVGQSMGGRVNSLSPGAFVVQGANVFVTVPQAGQ